MRNIFFTNNNFSRHKEYSLNLIIFEKHKGYRSSPNYITTEIKGVKRDINIHNYCFEEFKYFNKIEIKIKNGFWGIHLIKEIKLKY